jgi:hypothetical protein
MSALMLSIAPGVFATDVKSGLGVTITTEQFVPQIWQCNDHRIVMDDGTEPGRISNDSQTLVERINNYAFEGEQVQWTVLAMDKNGIEKIGDVYVALDDNIEANCKVTTDVDSSRIPADCNARILEENITRFDPTTMAYYTCTLTVETPDSMYGEHEVTVEATDLSGETGKMAEVENWFFNPTISLSVERDISFDNVRPGTSSYSDLVKVGNDADAGSGVLLDMFISGTDFYDSSSSGAKCPSTNQLSLNSFAYHATNGAYSSSNDLEVGRTCDAEGYCQINYGIGFNNPNPFNDKNEILQAHKVGSYYTANVLAPGSKIGLTFRLNLPEPCNGNFDKGQIYFWGEAV